MADPWLTCVKVYLAHNVFSCVQVYFLVSILQGYDSIRAEIPDPKAKKVCLFTTCFDKFLNNKYTYLDSKITTIDTRHNLARI
jgi:hypothetical protein